MSYGLSAHTALKARLLFLIMSFAVNEGTEFLFRRRFPETSAATVPSLKMGKTLFPFFVRLR